MIDPANIVLGSIKDYPTVYDENFMFSCKPFHAVNSQAPRYPSFQHTVVTIINDTNLRKHIHFETAEKCQQRGSDVLEACFEGNATLDADDLFNIWFSHNCDFSLDIFHEGQKATVSPTERVSNHALTVLFPHLKAARKKDCVIL